MDADRYVIDSSVFVAFYREIDDSHQEALRMMQEFTNATLIVHPYVIQETATVLTYGTSVSLAKRFLTDIKDASNVVIPALDIQSDIRVFMYANARLSFTDVSLIRLAKETHSKLITFDKQMMRLARRLS